MLRRDLLRSLLAMPLPGWLRHGMPRLFSRADSQETDAAALYRSAFGWTKGLRSEVSDRLRNAATIAVDGPDIDALIRHARSALKSLRKAAVMRQCDWGVEPIVFRGRTACASRRGDAGRVGLEHPTRG